MNRCQLMTSCVLMLSLSIKAQPSQIKRGGEVSVPIISSGFTQNFNPYTTKSTFHGILFEPLFVFNNISGKIHYRLVQSITYSKDLKRLELQLRDELKWSDTKPLTAKDVVFSFNLIKKYPALDREKIWQLGNLIEVKAIDDQKVVFNLQEADSTFYLKTASYPIIPEHIWNKVRDIFSFTNLNPIGSGPMTQVSLADAKQIRLCRNPHYYLQGLPYLDCINLRSYKDNAQIHSALVLGEIDWGVNFFLDVETIFIGQDKANKHYWYPPNEAINLYLNTAKSPLNNEFVRHALSMALNRQDIVEVALYGYPKANFHVGGVSDYYKSFVDDKINKTYGYVTQYNARRANVLLDKVGIIDQDGDGFRDNKNRTPIDLTIEVVKDWPEWVRASQMIAQFFKEIGIKTQVKALDWVDYETNLREGSYDMSLSWSINATNPIDSFRQYYHSSLIGKGYHVSHGMNSQEIDELIESFSKEANQQKQQQILNKLQWITAENLPFIPLFSNPTWFQYRSDKVTGWPNENNPYVQPLWHDAGKRVLILNKLYAK